MFPHRPLVRDAYDVKGGYVERGECLSALGRPADAAPYFKTAFELLFKDADLVSREPERLAQLVKLAGC